jgi:indolepyruvate ferredoxin oxidoreductase alpha subunit
MLRMTTRICHTSGGVDAGETRAVFPEPGKYPRNVGKYVMVPANARKHHGIIEHRIRELTEYAETCVLNQIEWRGKKLGILTGGVAYQYAREVFPDASTLKLGMVYPLPPNLIRKFAAGVERLIVLEELDPFIEDQVRSMGIEVYQPEGFQYPLTKSIFPIEGELDPRVVRMSAERAGLLPESEPEEFLSIPQDLPVRPPVLCPGCPHRGAFFILHKLGVPVNGDIGCYTLGVAPPLNSIDTCGCMGASIGVAHGAAIAGDKERHVAVIGDSTFFHSGIPALINVAYNRSNVITIIMDNRITGMTGHQENPGTGKTLQGVDTIELEIEPLVRAIGIRQVKTLEGHDVEGIEKILKEWMKSSDPAVLITREECALLPSARKRWLPLEVMSEKCNGCTMCFRIGCPAVLKSEQHDLRYGRPLAEIDQALCTGCEICAQVCPRDAILFREQMIERLSGA